MITPIKCDCESNNCASRNVHLAGSCHQEAHTKIEFFSYRENLCDNCRDSINLIDRLAGDYKELERWPLLVRS